MGPVGGELYSCILLPTATRRYILRIGRRSVCLSAVRRAAGPGGGLALGAGGHPHNYMCCMFCFRRRQPSDSVDTIAGRKGAERGPLS